MKKILSILIILLIIYLIIYSISWIPDFSFGKKPEWGVTFSQFYAQEKLGLNWQEAYQAILNDLNPQKLRLIAYWDYLETEKEKFNFEDLDWQIKEAEEKEKEIILVIGHRVPRWPECHHPNWVKDLNKEEFQEVLLNYLKEIVNHYKTSPSIKAWQVENEPLFFLFGNCPKPDRKFLKEEINLVKSLDPERKIIITDSGELSTWSETAGLSEILGTTLYRTVWNKYLGWTWQHLYSPFFYTFRAFLVKTFSKTKEVIISELQAEPWEVGEPWLEITLIKQKEEFDPKQLKGTFWFAKKTGINQIYLWGVEWWYWRKIKGDESYWNLGKEIFK